MLAGDRRNFLESRARSSVVIACGRRHHDSSRPSLSFGRRRGITFPRRAMVAVRASWRVLQSRHRAFYRENDPHGGVSDLRGNPFHHGRGLHGLQHVGVASVWNLRLFGWIGSRSSLFLLVSAHGTKAAGATGVRDERGDHGDHGGRDPPGQHSEGPERRRSLRKSQLTLVSTSRSRISRGSHKGQRQLPPFLWFSSDWNLEKWIRFDLYSLSTFRLIEDLHKSSSDSI